MINFRYSEKEFNFLNSAYSEDFRVYYVTKFINKIQLDKKNDVYFRKIKMKSNYIYLYYF